MAVVAAALLSLQANAGETPATFQSTACHVQFRYPRTWRARTLPRPRSGGGPQCVIVVDPPAWNRILNASEYEVEGHAIFVKVYHAAFSETAAKARFFLLDDGKWRILGRGNDFPAPIATSCCFGLRGHMTYGRFRKNGEGGYQGLGEYDHAILSSTRKTVVVSAPGGNTPVFERILNSLKVN